jgi:hypothetical protein
VRDAVELNSLQVGAVCWLLAEWDRSAVFELALDECAEFGLSRFSASRGLDTLEVAGLVSAARRPGRSPVVLIGDPTCGPGQTDGLPLDSRDDDKLPLGKPRPMRRGRNLPRASATLLEPHTTARGFSPPKARRHDLSDP